MSFNTDAYIYNPCSEGFDYWLLESIGEESSATPPNIFISVWFYNDNIQTVSYKIEMNDAYIYNLIEKGLTID
jgi:hypothetical protein